MTAVLQVGDRAISAEELVDLLTRYRLLPQLLQDIVVDQAIADVHCTSEEEEASVQEFCQIHRMATQEQQKAWLHRYGMDPEHLKTLAVRDLKIKKYKHQTWGSKLESYFLSRKSQLDRFIYRLIRTKDMGLAQELYFRIQEQEQSFAEMALQYSQGPEVQTEGLIGPVESGKLHPTLRRILSTSQPGQLWPPVPVDDWIVIVRLERIIPAQLDEAMKQQLLDELLANWVREQVDHLQWHLPLNCPSGSDDGNEPIDGWQASDV